MTVVSTPTTTLYPARKGPRPMTAEDLWTIPRVGGPEPARDGSFLIVPVTTWNIDKNESRTRLWHVPTGGGDPRPLTGAEVSSGEPALSPDGTRLAFTRKGPNGKPQVHVLPLAGGEAECVTELPLGAFDPKWLPDGNTLVFGAKLFKGHLTIEATKAEAERREKEPVRVHITEDRFYRYWDTWLTTGEVPHLFVLDLATRALRDLTPESTLWFEWMEPGGNYDVSPNGREIAFAGIAYDTDKREQRSAIYTVPVTGGPVKCLTPDHPASDFTPRYTPDGRFLVYGMQEDPYFYADQARVMAFDRASGTHTRWFREWTCSPTHWAFADDGLMILEAESEGRCALFAARGSEAAVPAKIVRGGTVASARPLSRGRVAFTHQDLVTPPEVHVVDVEGRAVSRLTRFTADAQTRYGVGEVREVQFEGAYGEQVQMFVVLPPGFEAGKKYPLVQVIHGGPHGISGDGFHWRWNAQAFAAPGYVVGLVNFQGSTSWGQDFARRIQGAWGDRPFQDVMLGTDVLVASGMVDDQRMAAAGGSYGGYMAAWVEGHTDRFKAIVNHAGVYDTLSQYASDWTMGRHQAFGGEPWGNIDAIHTWNPAHHARGFVTPMLVLHGEKDYRVPVTQGLECYGVLKAKGVPARLVYFEDENHWILKPRNSLIWYREVLGWLERWLGKNS